MDGWTWSLPLEGRPGDWAIASAVILLMLLFLCLWFWQRRRRGSPMQWFTLNTMTSELAPSPHFRIDGSAEQHFVIHDIHSAAQMERFLLRPKSTPTQFGELEHWQRRQVLGLAEHDFQQSRGLAHRKFLLLAERKIQRRHHEISNQISRAQRDLQSLDNEKELALLRALEQHLIETRLSEVSGIGPALLKRILSELKPRLFKDLRYASTVQGVGDSRQTDIDAWVLSYHRQLPSLVQSGFPQKAGIEKKYEDETALYDTRIAAFRAQQKRLNNMLDMIHKELAWLNVVTADHFMSAMSGSQEDTVLIERFSIGIFGEWEPVPSWFQELSEMGE